ncbi:MAG: diacylglycerol kinase, partial [Chitinophagaceae bacterium]|nr:diacylglycerol kinase [Chitinophagaceae bacterium]
MVISRIRSIAFAIAGIRHMLILELNARIHLLATVAVIIAGIIYGLTPIKWIALALAIGL